MSKPTINDVAKLAGVSIKSVSRVLNEEPHVRDVLRDRVQAAVKALDYRPNASARALAGSRSYLLGLYLNNPSRGYVSQIEYGALRACRSSGYHLLVEEISGSAEEIRRRVEELHLAVKMDGVILTPPLTDNPAVLATLKERNTPVVCIAPAPQNFDASVGKVFMDDREAAWEMTRRLIALGHRDIAFIAGPSTHAAARLRLDGYKAAMAEAGLRAPAAWVREGHFTFRSGLHLGEALLSGARRPTAVFAANDDMALGVMAVAHRLHLDVPGELSIVGFDDSPSAEVVWPQLTTIRQPVEEMAAAATEMLIQMNRDKGSSGDLSRKLDFQLVERASAGPPPQP